jgi:UDP-N-acetylmuramyl pentapeptide phosphotransferase/UDP-N-acetylglucosamine-1-phosphate transferase
MWTIVAVALLGALVLTGLLTWCARGVARRRGFVDQPGGHKGHVAPVALGGGVAIFLAVCLPALAGVILARVALAADDASWVPAVAADSSFRNR